MSEENIKEHIIFPIEIKKREYLSRLLLAVHAVNDGYPVIIGDRIGCHQEVENLSNASIYLAKSLTVNLIPFFEKIKHQNTKIIVLFEEGGYVIRENNKYEEIKSFYPEKMLSYVDCLMTYGKSYQDLLIENFQNINHSNSYISGNSRFDLHKPKYAPLYEEQVKKIKRKYGKYILANTNFGLANHNLGDEFIANEFKNSKDFTRELIDYYLDLQKKQKNDHHNFCDMIKAVALKFPDYSIIVRPHPIENVEFYKSEFKRIKNVSVTNDGSATPWIIGSELVIHKDCTTGIESSFSKKPIISYQSTSDPNILWLASLVSDIAKDEDELMDKLYDYLINKKKFELTVENVNILANEVINVNYSSAELFLKLIKGLKKNLRVELNMGNSEELGIFSNKHRIKIFLERLKRFAGWYRRKFFKKDIYSISFEGLSKKEVRSSLDKYIAIENMDLNYVIKRKGINTFLIHKINK